MLKTLQQNDISPIMHTKTHDYMRYMSAQIHIETESAAPNVVGSVESVDKTITSLVHMLRNFYLFPSYTLNCTTEYRWYQCVFDVIPQSEFCLDL